ncbi:MAG: ABC transporter ATP-binding protein [Gemmatimonadota bacterium]
MSAFALEAGGLTFRYPEAARPAVRELDLRVPAGCFYAVLGPNGSGKSTLTRLLLGALAPTAGEVRYAGRPLAGWERRALARRVGVVAQGEEAAFPMTVRELVAMGRYPHLGPWRREGAADRAAVERALERCEVGALAERPLATLSGGERQRARLARALAQEPETLVLDEPTAALDVAHEMAIFELLAGLARRGGATVLVVTHNLNLAARYADRLLLLNEGGMAAEGLPEAVLTKETLERVYGWPVAVVPHPGPGPDAGAPQVIPLAPDRSSRSSTA